MGGIQNGKLVGNEYDARKLRDKVVDEEGSEAMKIWQEKGQRCRMYEPEDEVCGCEDRRHVYKQRENISQ